MSMATPMIERYRDVEGRWRWRLLAADGHPLADGVMAFDDEDALFDHLDRLRRLVPTATICETRPSGADHSCFVTQPGTGDEWRWHLIVTGDHVADSGEGYADRSGAEASAEHTADAIASADVRTWGA